jgi:hypothetical protein
MTLAEERAFEREMQAIADAVSGILNEAPSLDAAPVGIALGLVQALKGGAHNTYLWPERMAEAAAFIARGALAEGGPPNGLFLDTEERDRFMERFRVALLHLAGIELPDANRRPTADDTVAPE